MSAAKRLRLLGTLGIAAVSLVSACSASAHVSVGGSNKVAKSDVESQVATQLAASTGQAKPDISCPDGLEAKVGATLDCTLSVQGDSTKLPVHVVVDSVDNGTAHFTAQVGGNKDIFCKDNATLSKAMSGSNTPEQLLPVLKANIATIDRFGKEAPDDIKADATALVNASHAAIDKNDASNFTDPTIAKSGANVDTYCGSDSSTTTAKP